MSLLKLQIGRENAISGTVQSVELDESGKFGPQYKVTFTTGDVMYQNIGPFDRQVAFHKLESTADLVGKELTFWRKPMPDDPSKGFFNIEMGSSGVDVSKMSQAVLNDDYVGRDLRRAGVPMRASSFDEIVDKYTETLGRAIAIAADVEETFPDRKISDTGLTSMAATLYIERNKAGV